MNPKLELNLARKSAVLLKRCQSALLRLKNGDDLSNDETLSTLARDIESHLSACHEDTVTNAWEIMAVSLRALACHFECRKLARDGAKGLQEKRQGLAIIVQEAKECISDFSNQATRASLLASLNENDEITNTTRFIESLLKLPAPTTYFSKNDDTFSQLIPKQEVKPEKQPSVVKVIAFLDGQPFVAPQLIRPETIYSLKFCIQGEGWPEDATELMLDLLTTCPTSTYSISPFVFKKPKILDKYDAELSGEIVFRNSQSVLADNIVFKVRCALRRENSNVHLLQAIGHTQIQLRVDSENNAMLASGYKSMDFHITGLLQHLIKECPNVKREMEGLMPVLQSLTTLLGAYAQDGVFKGVVNVPEQEFHKKVKTDLRFLGLGQDLQDHPHQGGGITDLRFHEVVIELKVENKIETRAAIAKKYSAQLTHYEGTEGRQVGVVLVLDLAEKHLPPGDIRNDIMLVSVPTHGGPDSDKKYPSKAFVFVINGNTINPSSYSV
jgi:hypothetical protein